MYHPNKNKHRVCVQNIHLEKQIVQIIPCAGSAIWPHWFGISRQVIAKCPIQVRVRIMRSRLRFIVFSVRAERFRVCGIVALRRSHRKIRCSSWWPGTRRRFCCRRRWKRRGGIFRSSLFRWFDGSRTCDHDRIAATGNIWSRGRYERSARMGIKSRTVDKSFAGSIPDEGLRQP